MSLHGSLGDLSISILSCLMMLLLWLVIECDGNNRRAFLQSAGNDRKAWFYVQMCMCSISACICAIIYAHIITHRYMMIHAYKEINEVVGLNGWIVISCCFNHDVHPCEDVFPMSSPWIIVYININIGRDCIFEGSLEVKLPTIWTVEKQRWEESEETRSEERRCRCAKR